DCRQRAGVVDGVEVDGVGELDAIDDVGTVAGGEGEAAVGRGGGLIARDEVDGAADDDGLPARRQRAGGAEDAREAIRVGDGDADAVGVDFGAGDRGDGGETVRDAAAERRAVRAADRRGDRDGVAVVVLQALARGDGPGDAGRIAGRLAADRRAGLRVDDDDGVVGDRRRID